MTSAVARPPTAPPEAGHRRRMLGTAPHQSNSAFLVRPLQPRLALLANLRPSPTPGGNRHGHRAGARPTGKGPPFPPARVIR